MRDEARPLVDELERAAKAYDGTGHDDARRRLRNAALKLALRLETPVDSHDRTLFEVRIFICQRGPPLDVAPSSFMADCSCVCRSPTEAPPSASQRTPSGLTCSPTASLTRQSSSPARPALSGRLSVSQKQMGKGGQTMDVVTPDRLLQSAS